jgi:alkanesulfonate monooxygenase SsuD/methylene tetrahydromethanopterin reductase-like flavin-dependent oxidoreductase (luciferase family)
MMSAIGPRNLRLAGALADIVQPQVGTHPDTIRWAVGHIRAGAEAAGRDPDQVEVSIFAATCISDDLEAAYHHCRWAPTTAAPSVQSVIRNNPDHDMPDSLVSALESLGPAGARASQDYYKAHAETDEDAAKYVSDELVDSFALVGPPERCLERLLELRDLGVGEVALGMLEGEYEQLDAVRDSIAPRLEEGS